jgi:hypothetical protein
MTDRGGKTMAGIARAASNTGSAIIDSGLSSSIEKFCIRKNIKLMGVSPEAQICYPKLTSKKVNELTNGHTHFFLIGKEDKSNNWGDESGLKFELAGRVAAGRSRGMGSGSGPACKVVTVVMGDNAESALADIEASINA